MDSILILVFGTYLNAASIENMTEEYKNNISTCTVSIGENGKYLAGKTLNFKGHSCNEVSREVERVVNNFSRGKYKIEDYAGIE